MFSVSVRLPRERLFAFAGWFPVACHGPRQTLTAMSTLHVDSHPWVLDHCCWNPGFCQGNRPGSRTRSLHFSVGV